MHRGADTRRDKGLILLETLSYPGSSLQSPWRLALSTDANSTLVGVAIHLVNEADQ